MAGCWPEPGFPVDLGGNFFLDPITGNTYTSGVDLTPQRPLYLHGSGFPEAASSTVASTPPIQLLACRREMPRRCTTQLGSRLQRLSGERRCSACVPAP